jgi:hypothetical protein
MHFADLHLQQITLVIFDLQEAAARASKEGRRITPQGSATEFEDDPLTRQRT